MNTGASRIRVSLAIIVALVLILGAAQIVQAAPGDLDSTFGEHGKVTHDFHSSSGLVNDDRASIVSEQATAVSAGDHTCALTMGGGVKCWGPNDHGQLGNGTTNSSSIPVDVVGLSTAVAAIAAGRGHTCALTTGGGVKCWGFNSQGQLGDGTTTDSPTPKDVSGLSSSVIAIASGYDHSCALTTDGGVKCWGDNVYGQLGDGTATSRSTPVAVAALTSGVAAISAGYGHTCALTTGGGAKCWGANYRSQLGDGSTTNSYNPVDVAGLHSGVAAVAASGEHTCAVTTGGGGKCWGNNDSGQVGDGTTSFSRSSPVDVVGLSSGVAAVSSGAWSHTCALTTVGGVKCWGGNTFGQLGDGTSGNFRTTPTDVVGLSSGMVAVSAGTFHTCAVSVGGGVKCWGYNDHGQLGDGTTQDRSTPIDVIGFGPAHAGGVVTVCDEAHLLAALAGGGTVTFSCSGTITLTAEIVISTDTTIDGTGQTVTISGNDAVRVFRVNEGVTLNLNALTIANGSAPSGGGIYNSGTVSVSNSTFTGNSGGTDYYGSGGAIFNDQGTLTVTDSMFSENSGIYNGGGGAIYDYFGTVNVSNTTFSGNSAGTEGGGIYSAGSLTVSNSTFSDNTAERRGGGIVSVSGGTLEVSNCAFSGNTAEWDGGGIYIDRVTASVTNTVFLNNNTDWRGGGIYMFFDAMLTVSNSTFSGNSAGAGYSGGGISIDQYNTLSVSNSTFSGNIAEYGGGIFSGLGTVTVSNSTFSDNRSDDAGGGIANYVGAVTVSNSTFSGNGAINGGSVYNNTGTLTLKNVVVANSLTGGNCYGLITDGGGNLSYPDTTCPGINADPLLGPLQYNGGPTWTMALGPSSAAIDVGDNSICAAPPVNNLDQRGVTRPQGSACDIGAYEYGVAPPQPPVVSISASGADASLTWPEVTLDIDGNPVVVTAYQVWRSQVPYFMAGDWSSPTPIAEVPTPGYLDPGVLEDVTQNYFYIVRAVGSSGLSSWYSNRVAEFTFGLVPGS